MDSIKFQAISTEVSRALAADVVAVFDLPNEDGLNPGAIVAWSSRERPTHGTHLAVVPPDARAYVINGVYDFAEPIDAVSDAYHRWLRRVSPDAAG
jgi:hypothetical protein